MIIDTVSRDQGVRFKNWGTVHAIEMGKVVVFILNHLSPITGLIINILNFKWQIRYSPAMVFG